MKNWRRSTKFGKRSRFRARRALKYCLKPFNSVVKNSDSIRNDPKQMANDCKRLTCLHDALNAERSNKYKESRKVILLHDNARPQTN